MNLDLSYIREQILDEEEGDEGEAVGSAGSTKDVKAIEEGKDAEAGEKKRKVKVGRGLGVGELVEKNEALPIREEK